MTRDTWRRRRAEGRCTRCGEKRPPGCTTRDCEACLSIGRLGESNAAKKAKADAALARVVETAKTMSSEQQAKHLGLSTDRIRYLRHRARERGYDVPREVGGVKAGTPFTAVESAKWRQLEASQARCECGLLLPCHDCIPSILELATSRRGPGRVMPEGGPTGMRIERRKTG